MLSRLRYLMLKPTINGKKRVCIKRCCKTNLNRSENRQRKFLKRKLTILTRQKGDIILLKCSQKIISMEKFGKFRTAVKEENRAKRTSTLMIS